MKKKDNGAAYMMKGFFILMSLGVFAYFIVGEVLLSKDRDKMGIWLYFLEEYGVEVLIILFLMAAGIISVVFSGILRLIYHERIIFGYLGWGIFLSAMWMISESKLRQILFTDLSLVEGLAFCAVMILPIPYFIYVDHIQKNRYQKIYTLMTFAFIILFAVYVGAKILGMDSYLNETYMKRGELAAAVSLVLITMLIDLIRKDIKEYSLAALGIVGFLLLGTIESILVMRHQTGSGGIILGIGLSFLLLMAALKTGQDILDIEEKKKQAILASESKEKFLANMSHEIRTPINTVIGMNEMILRENQDEEIQEYARNIQRASKMLLSLVNDILDFSKIEAGKLELVESPYQLASLLNDEIHVLKAKAEKKNLDVQLNIEEDLPSVLNGDEVRIKQIFTNLLTNSVKYTKEGRITLSVQGEWSDRGEFTLKMSVADTGMGIKKEDISRLFDSFTRLEEKKNRTIEGTGLGLNITKHLVDQMEGTIEVQSVYGKGSLFTVRIPQEVLNDEVVGNLQEAYEKEIDEQAEYKESFRAPEAEILAVDDNEMNLAVVRGLLKGTEIRLDTALSGTECLNLCSHKKYDLILMDHMMPEPDGIETLHMIREDKDGPNADTKVIALTANAIAGVREEYLREGFTDYLSKPIEAEKLERLLKRQLPKELVILEEVTLHSESGEQTDVEEKKFTEQMTEEEAEVIQKGRHIDRKTGIAYCNDNEGMYEEILKVYHEQGQKYQLDLREFHEKKDWKSYEILVHAIKSNSMSIGAKEFSEEAKSHEMAAKEQNEVFLEEEFQKFCTDYEDVLAEAGEILQIEQPSEAQEEGVKESISKEELLEECQLLLDHIQNFEMNEALVLVGKLEKKSIDGENTEGIKEVLERVKTAVDGFDYDSAENCLNEWLVGR